jgi:hypothetical protein
MAADFKSHILRRDEKGLFGVPFKRLLMAGIIAGFTYTLSNLALPLWSIPLAAGVGIVALVLTGLRGGIPLWERLMYRLRGAALLRAARNPAGIVAQIAHLMEMPLHLLRLDGASVFAPPTPKLEIDLREWITFAHAAEEDGLVFVDSPLKGGLHD